MSKRIFVFVIILLFLMMTGCELQPVERKEQPHLYWKNIDVVVENVDQRHWFAAVHRYEIHITVYSEEYNLRKTLSYSSSGMYTPEHWGVQKGDIVTAELYSWVMDSTGEVVRRDIHTLK